MGDGWLGHIKGFHNVADTLFSLQQHHQDLLPGVVGQGFAKLEAIDRLASLRGFHRHFSIRLYNTIVVRTCQVPRFLFSSCLCVFVVQFGQL